MTDFRKYVDYISNTGQPVLACSVFDDDWAPIGRRLRRDMERAGLIEQWLGGLMLTRKAEVIYSVATPAPPRDGRPK
jgi:hypothetical protein